MIEAKFQLANKADHALTWEREDMHAPMALTPLAGDYMTLVLEGINQRNARWGIPQRLMVQVVNGFLYVAVEASDIPGAEVAETVRQMARAKVPDARRFWENDVMPALVRAYADIESVDAETMTLSDLAAAWAEVWALVPHVYELHFQVTSTSYRVLEDLADAYEAVIEDAHPGEALKLVQGRTKELQRTQRDMYRLCQKTFEVPGLSDLILSSPDEALSAIFSTDGEASFREAFDRFLTTHGHLGQAHDDLLQPSWSEDPILLIAEIATRIRAGNPDPQIKLDQQLEESKRTEDSLLEILADRPHELADLSAKIAIAREVGPLTEDHNYWIDRMLHSKVRAFVFRVGSRMVGERILRSPEDVFFLHLEEVRAALSEGRAETETIDKRRDVLSTASTLDPPATLGAEPKEQDEPPSRFGGGSNVSDDESVVKGSAASVGKATGPARLVLSTQDFAKVEGGDILVCPSSNPSYVPLFGVIAGLVTDTGGVTSHAAVVAREFGVPAVVGTRRATKSFVDGDVIEVDGFTGEVRKL